MLEGSESQSALAFLLISVLQNIFICPDLFISLLLKRDLWKPNFQAQVRHGSCPVAHSLTQGDRKGFFGATLKD